MTFTFKLSRRLARFRRVLPTIALLVGVACEGDPSGPGPSTGSGASKLNISPTTVSLGVNQAVQFTATDSSNSSLSLSRTGSGKGRGRPKTAVVSVAVSPDATTLQISGSSRFTAVATLSDGSSTTAPLRWTATGGTVDSTGLYKAGFAPGTYRVIAAASNGVSDTAAVTVAALAPVVAQLTLNPASTSLAEGSSVQFSAIGKAKDGSNVGVSPKFTATGGTVGPTGLYTAGRTPGSFRIIATDSITGIADTASVVVTNPPTTVTTVTAVTLTPPTVALVSGSTRQFAAIGTMTDSSTTPITVTWSATGGTISSTGLYTAGGTSGTFRVIGTQPGGTLADTSAVTISPAIPTLAAVVLNPSSATLEAGGTQLFAASGRMSDGSTTAITATFTATGGTISGSGLYTAGTTAGTFRVIATQQGGTLADSASVTVTAVQPPPTGSCARTVNSNTVSGFTSAVSGALPGDCIYLAPGTYTFESSLTVSRSGTAAQPIIIQGAGSGSTILDMNLHNLTFQDAPYVHIRKLRVTNLPQGGWWLRNSSYAVLDSLEVDHSLNEMIAVKDGSHNVIIQNSWCHDTGTLNAYYGECFYFGGSGMDAAHPIDCGVVDNQVLNNRTGPNVRSNAIDIKPCADRTVIRGNYIDGTGTVWDQAHGLGALIDVNASGTVIENNTIKLGNPNAVKFYAPPSGIPPMSGTIARNNTIDLENIHNAPSGSYYGFNRTSDTYYSGVTIYCNNTVTNGPFGTNPCTP